MAVALRAFCRLWRGNIVIYLYYIIITYGARVRVVCTLDTRLQRDNRSGGGGTVTTIQREIMKRKQKEK